MDLTLQNNMSLFILLVWVFCLNVCRSSRKTEEGLRSLGTGVVDSCKPLCRCRESNPGLLEQQPVHLTVGPSPQPYKYIFSLHLLTLLSFSESQGLQIS